MSEIILSTAQPAEIDTDDSQLSSHGFRFQHPLFASMPPAATDPIPVEQLVNILHSPEQPSHKANVAPLTPADYMRFSRQPLGVRKLSNDSLDVNTPAPSKEQPVLKSGRPETRWRRVGRVGLGPPKRAERQSMDTMATSTPLAQPEDHPDTSRSGKSSVEVSIANGSHDSARSECPLQSGMEHSSGEILATTPAVNAQRRSSLKTVTAAHDAIRPPLLATPAVVTPKKASPPATLVCTAAKSVKFNFNDSSVTAAPRTVTSHAQPPPTMALDGPLPAAVRKPKALVRIVMNGREYTRLDQIGKGGSSKVFRVMAPNGRIFALKRVDFEQADQATIQGYKSEIELLKRMASSTGAEHIIRLYDAEINDAKGRLMMLMEAGEIDLAHMLTKQADSVPDFNFIRLYWRHMLEAVQAVHDQHIVHSDLKPANFLLVEGALKLIDFGIAKTIGNDTTNIHRDQQIGTVNYMSPEALSDTGGNGARLMKLGRASDVWSLGCILYQMVYGRTPFAHLTMIQKIQAIPNAAHRIDFPTRAYPPAMASSDAKDESFARTVDGDLLRVMRGCLERDAKQRLTITELLKDSFLRPEDKVARPLRADQVNVGLAELTELLRLTVAQTREKTLSRVAIADSDIQVLSRDFFDHLRHAR